MRKAAWATVRESQVSFVLLTLVGSGCLACSSLVMFNVCSALAKDPLGAAAPRLVWALEDSNTRVYAWQTWSDGKQITLSDGSELLTEGNMVTSSKTVAPGTTAQLAACSGAFCSPA